MIFVVLDVLHFRNSFSGRIAQLKISEALKDETMKLSAFPKAASADVRYQKGESLRVPSSKLSDLSRAKHRYELSTLAIGKSIERHDVFGGQAEHRL